MKIIKHLSLQNVQLLAAAIFILTIIPHAEAKWNLAWDTSTALRKTGYLDVTLPPYNIDNTGNINKASSNTTQLNAAIAYAYNKNLVVFFPAGTYWVNNQILCQATYNKQSGTQGKGKPFANVLIGSKAGARPLIKLKNNSSGFNTNNPTHTTAKALIRFELDNLQHNLDYNSVFKGIDIDLGNNKNAAGIYHRAAEGSVTEDTKITGSNFFCGILDLPGSGGSTSNVEVDGGKHGIYAHAGQANPLVTGLYLKNQSHEAIVSRLHGPLTVVGFEIEHSNTSPVIKIYDLVNSNTKSSHGHINLVDGVIDRSTNGKIVNDIHQGAVYIRNVFMKNAKHIEWDTTDTAAQVTGTQNGWCHVKEYSGYFKKTSSKLVGNVGNMILSRGEESEVLLSYSGTIPTDFTTKHIWDENSFPHFEGNVIDVAKAPYNIDPKNGTASDLNALQAAIDDGSSQGKAVFLPKGDYYINGTLHVHANTKLFGVAKNLSRIYAKDNWSEASLTPMIQTENKADTSLILATFFIAHQPDINTKVYPINWRSGGDAIMRGLFIHKDIAGSKLSNSNFHKVQFVNNAGGKIYNLVLNGGAKGTEAPGYRRFYVNNTAGNPLNIYTMTLQYAEGLYQGELRNASNVTIFSYKTETDQQDINLAGLLVKNSTNIKIYGQSGIAQMGINEALIEIDGGDDILIANSSRWSTPAHPANQWYYTYDNSEGKGIKADREVAFYKKGNPTDVHPQSGSSSIDALNAWIVAPPISVTGNDVISVQVQYSTAPTGNRSLRLELTKDKNDWSPANLAVNEIVPVPNGKTDALHTFQVTIPNGYASAPDQAKWRVRLMNGNAKASGTDTITQTEVTIFAAVHSVDAVTAWMTTPPTVVTANDVLSIQVHYSTAPTGNKSLCLELTKDKDNWSATNLAVDETVAVSNGQTDAIHTFQVTIPNGYASVPNEAKWRARLMNGYAKVSGTDTLTQVGASIYNAALGNQEIEDLIVVASSGDTQSWINSGSVMFYNSNAVNDFITFSVNFPNTGNYSIYAGFKTHMNNGSIRVKRGNGLNLGNLQDLYSASVQLEERQICTAEYFTAGMNDIKFKVVGKNASSGNYHMRLNYIRVEFEN